MLLWLSPSKFFRYSDSVWLVFKSFLFSRWIVMICLFVFLYVAAFANHECRHLLVHWIATFLQLASMLFLYQLISLLRFFSFCDFLMFFTQKSKTNSIMPGFATNGSSWSWCKYSFATHLQIYSIFKQRRTFLIRSWIDEWNYFRNVLRFISNSIFQLHAL